MEVFKKLNYVPAFWYSSNNFGDSLSHYLIKKISGKTPVLVNPDNDCDKVMVTGSILNNDVKNAIVWGCGLAFSTDIVPVKKKILAVRGKLTGELLKEQEIDFDEVYGDPALILPRIYNPDNVVKKYKLGIIPHYVDTLKVYSELKCSDSVLNENSIKIIDINNDVESFVLDILSCEKLISSSLHGVICCHAYKLPCDWVKFSDGVGGDDFKFKDYYSTTFRKDTSFLDLRSGIDLRTLKNIINQHPIYNTDIEVDVEKLWEACPFKV